ncbi:hypothetical protein [Micromonospora humi]|uniref:Uncharacterized protein n=1 Tax=Micromonospora humi TaxID=745366 RepID=A0A1C5GU74_9ACTN|nr:hypothetical protein [Micromonospora humi]SCG37293.1 hypothetical protein GA0070213_101561 [Micromonospora humi]
MGEVRPLPEFGDLFGDLRGEDRTLRVSYHPDRGAVVLSLWTGPRCRGSFRLAATDLDRFLDLLTVVRDDADRDSTGTGVVVDAPTDPAVERTGQIAVERTEPIDLERTGQIDATAHRVAWPVPRVA